MLILEVASGCCGSMRHNGPRSALKHRSLCSRSHDDVSTTQTPQAAKSLRPALSAYTIPRLPRSQELAIRAIALLAYGYGVYWIVWRWRHTLNFQHPTFSVVLVLAETFGLLSMAVFIFTACGSFIASRRPRPKG